MIASGKGGVGKSTVASYLAITLARLGLQIALLDADITGPSLPHIFGLQNLSPNLRENSAKPLPFFKFGIQILSFGHFIEASQPVSHRGPMLAQNLRKMLDDVAWSECDILIVDMPPSTSDLSLMCCQILHQASVLLVLQPDPLSISDARRAANHYFEMQVPITGFVENFAKAPQIAPICQELSQNLDIPILHSILQSPEIHEYACYSRPLALFNHPDFLGFEKLGKTLLSKLEISLK